MSEEPSVDVAAGPGPGVLPLLPRGEVLFEELPLKAVVLEALAPTLGHGCLVVRDSGRGAVVLVRDGALVEVHALDGAEARTGEGVLPDVQRWADAQVSAHRLDSVLVDVCEALLCGEVIYSDMRLDWVEWPALLADLGRRGGTYAVEIFTPAGRGVTCVAAGVQTLSYTDIHPSLGDPALLEAMASNRDGSIRVRRLATIALAVPAALSSSPFPAPATAAAATPAPAMAGFAAAEHANGTAQSEPDRAADQQLATPSGSAAAAADTRRPEPVGALADEVLPDLTWVAPWQTPWRDETVATSETTGAMAAAPSSPRAKPSVDDMLVGLRSIAQRRLQLSASRVESVLEEAAREQRPLDTVLEEIRAMSIRGVMPSTVDAMVAEMKIAAAEYRSS